MSYSECLTPYSWVFYSECPPYSKCPTPYSRESYSKCFTPYSRESYSECSTPYKCALLRIDTIRSPASHKNPSSVGTWRPAHNIKNDVLTCRIQMVKRDNKSRTRIFTLSKQASRPTFLKQLIIYGFIDVNIETLIKETLIITGCLNSNWREFWALLPIIEYNYFLQKLSFKLKEKAPLKNFAVLTGKHLFLLKRDSFIKKTL